MKRLCVIFPLGLLTALTVFLVLVTPGTTPLADTPYPPIYITINAHGHNYGIPEEARHSPETLARLKKTSYDEHHAETMWLAKETERVGARMSYQLNGEYALDATINGDARHLRKLEQRGHSMGAHFHRYTFTGINNYWDEYASWQASWGFVGKTWKDHLDAIKEALGNEHPPTRVDPATGETDKNDKFHLEYNTTIEPVGEVFSYTEWNMKPWTPFRRKADTYLQEDTNGPRIGVSSIGQVGKGETSGLHSIYTTVPQLKRHFLALLAEWREHQRLGDSPQIWSFGIMTHPGQNAKYHEEMTELLRFFASFTRSTTPDGTPVAQFATDSEVAAAFEAWEAEYPGESAFDFDWETHLDSILNPPGTPQPYPYSLEGVVLGLKDCELVEELDTWKEKGVRAFHFVRREITRGELNRLTGQSSMTIGEIDEKNPVYLLWSETGVPVSINFSSQQPGGLFVKNGESGALSLVPSVYLKVSPQAMVVSSTKAGL
jgi:hypothetical protein